MSLYSILGSRFLLLLLGRSFLLFVGLAIVALLTRKLGAAGFGIYRAAVAYLGLVVVLADLGLASIFVREISRDGADQTSIVGPLLSLRLIVSSFVMFVAVLLSFVLGFSDETRAGILLGATGYVAYSAHLMLFGVFQQKLKQRGVLLAEVVGALFFVAVVMFNFDSDVPASAFVGLFGASYAATFLISVYFANRLVPIRLAFDLKLWIDTLRMAAPLAVASVLGVIYVRADTVLLALFHPPAVAGIYGVPIKISDSVLGIALLFSGLMAPVLARSASRNRADFVAVFSDALGVLVVGAVCGGILIFVGAEDIVRLLGGNEFLGGAPILRILTVFMTLHAATLLMRETTVSLGIQARLLPVYVTAIFVAAIAYALLVPTYGGHGAALALVVTELFVICGIAMIIHRNVGQPVSYWLPLRVLACGIATIVTFQVAIPQTWATLYAAAAAMLIYFTLLLLSRTLNIGRVSRLLSEMLGARR
jgi:O-antigen/teichoic acid export membrane protein